MHSRTSWLAALIAALLTVVAPASPATAAHTPRMIDLGAGAAHQVNARGDILGADGSGAYIVWDHRDYRPTYVGLYTSDWSGGTDLNERGDAVMREFYWHDGMLSALAHPNGGFIINAALNDRGVIAGTRYADGQRRAFIYHNGVFTDFPGHPGATGTTAVDINDRGQVLIEAVNNTGSAETLFPLIWWRGQVIELGSLGSGYTYARQINNNGMVIGEATNATGALSVFRWQNGVMTPLGGTEQGGGVAYGINNRGDVVGRLGMTAVLWRDGVPVELTPGQDSSAEAVNDRGEVAGNLSGPAVPWSSFRWRNGKATLYTSPRQTGYASAAGIDLRGRLVTNIYLDQEAYHAVVWIDRNG
jgi:probable HAF family extracellular repeat protein